MNFDLSDEQQLLGDEARRVLADRASYRRQRALFDSGEHWDAPLWREIAELGWLGAAIPEEFGGAGRTHFDLCVIAYELGRCVAPIPFASSIGLAAQAILLAGTPEQKSRYLPKLASGELVGTFAFAEGPGSPPDRPRGTRLAEGRLNGVKYPVPDAQIAHLAVVSAVGSDGQALALVDLDQRGVTRTSLTSIDPGRQHAMLEFRNASAEALGAPGSGAAELGRLLDHAATLTAFEQVGGTEAVLEMGKNYVMQRRTFGRWVGSYQAVKHRLADLWVGLELARSNAYFAAWTASSDERQLPLAAAAARLSATEAYGYAAEENLHLHGGIGYTWEADCHFHYRRARLLAVSLGSSAYWSDRLMNQLTEPAAAGGGGSAESADGL
jgi:alkylation response protein AidB-like acyl-CoA dehydrogenase